MSLLAIPNSSIAVRGNPYYGAFSCGVLGFSLLFTLLFPPLVDAPSPIFLWSILKRILCKDNSI